MRGDYYEMRKFVDFKPIVGAFFFPLRNLGSISGFYIREIMIALIKFGIGKKNLCF